MKQSEIARKQFNKQARAFSNWMVTKNLEYLKGISEFIGLNPDDALLDVACGTGEFALYVSPGIKNVVGIDVSEKMIEIASEQKNNANIVNAVFKVAEVSKIPYPGEFFDVVFSKSAFHHFEKAAVVFAEMVRCCKNNGKIGICDILAFEDQGVDKYFEEFEKEVDVSHYRTLSKGDFMKLFETNNLKIERIHELEIEHVVSEYLSHAIRSRRSEKRIDSLIKQAQTSDSITNYWTFGDGRGNTKFRKKVILIIGRK